MSLLVTIGDFSRMTHLSIKALRHYHEVGLLEPADVDPSSGYRLYDAGQVPTAQVIRRFRDLGMPIEEVRAMLSSPDVQTRNKVITAHLERMESQLAHTAATVASLKAMLESPSPASPVEYRRSPATAALAISSWLQVGDFDAWWSDAFSQLRSALDLLPMDRAGADGALYPSEFFELEEGEVVAFLPMPDGSPQLSLPEGIELITVPAAELAVMVHSGSFHDLDRTYGALGTVVNRRGVGVEGPIREYYLRGPFDGGDEAGYRTEVCWPVIGSSPGSAVQ